LQVRKIFRSKNWPAKNVINPNIEIDSPIFRLIVIHSNQRSMATHGMKTGLLSAPF